MSGKVGQPFVPSADNYAKDTGGIMVCVTGAEVVMDDAALGAAIVADGGAFIDPANPAAEPVAFDPANADHEILSVSVQSFYCGSDPCKDGELVTATGVCVTDASGDVFNLEQGGMGLLDGSELAGPVEAGSSITVPAGAAARICYVIQNKALVAK